MRFVTCLASILLAALTAPAHADLVISIEPETFQEGRAGSLNVFVESPGGAELNYFQLQFHVVLSSDAGRLEFAAPDFNDLAADPDYVFFNLGSPFGSVATGALPKDTFNTGDSLSSGGPDNVAIAPGPGGRRLLARLVLVPGAGVLTPPAGSEFTVTLSSNSTGTYFNSYDASTGDDVPVPFTSVPAGVVVTAAVPEPLAALSLAVGMLGVLAARRLQKAA